MKIIVGSALFLGIGGVRSYVDTLKKALEINGHEFDIAEPNLLGLKNKMIASLMSYGNKDKARKELIKLQAIGTQKKMINILNNIQNKKKCIIHVQDALCASIVNDLKAPLVLTVHGPLSREVGMHGKTGNIYYSYLYQSEKKGYERADRIIAVDTGQKEIIINDFGIMPEKISVILNAVDTELFAPIDTSNIKNNKHNVSYYLVPRRLVPKNGVSIAIEAFKILEDTTDELWIAGEGPDRSSLEEQVKREKLSGKVRFLGAISQREMVEIMNFSKGIIIPSIPINGVIEASSISALEGMSVSKPVIASNIGGLAEMIIHKSNGLLFDAGNSYMLSESIKMINSNLDLSNQIGKRAREYVIENHSKEVWIKKIEEVYHKAHSDFYVGNQNI